MASLGGVAKSNPDGDGWIYWFSSRIASGCESAEKKKRETNKGNIEATESEMEETKRGKKERKGEKKRGEKKSTLFCEKSVLRRSTMICKTDGLTDIEDNEIPARGNGGRV